MRSESALIQMNGTYQMKYCRGPNSFIFHLWNFWLSWNLNLGLPVETLALSITPEAQAQKLEHFIIVEALQLFFCKISINNWFLKFSLELQKFMDESGDEGVVFVSSFDTYNLWIILRLFRINISLLWFLNNLQNMYDGNQRSQTQIHWGTALECSAGCRLRKALVAPNLIELESITPFRK